MSRLILSGNGSYFEWNTLKAVMLTFSSWCTLDINIAIDNCSLLKLNQSQTLQSIFGQHSKKPEKNIISKIVSEYDQEIRQ